MNIFRLSKKLEESLLYKIVTFSDVVEQLLVNSIEAESTIIHILFSISNTSVEVIDNGVGIHLDVLKELPKNLTTTKNLKNEKYYFGAHGNSINFISRISETIEISTHFRSNQKTFFKSIKRGEAFSLTEKTPREVGTSINLKNVFFNYPIRKRIVKEKRYEEILKIRELGLIYSSMYLVDQSKKNLSIQIKCIDNEQTIFSCFPNHFSFFSEAPKQKLNLIEEILSLKDKKGNVMFNYLQPISTNRKEDSLRIEGVVSNYLMTKKQDFQWIYVNNRLIINKTLIDLIQSYFFRIFKVKNSKKSLLNLKYGSNSFKMEEKKYPVIIIHIKIKGNDVQNYYDRFSYSFQNRSIQFQKSGESKIKELITIGMIYFLRNNFKVFLSDSELEQLQRYENPQIFTNTQQEAEYLEDEVMLEKGNQTNKKKKQKKKKVQVSSFDKLSVFSGNVAKKNDDFTHLDILGIEFDQYKGKSVKELIELNKKINPIHKKGNTNDTKKRFEENKPKKVELTISKENLERLEVIKQIEKKFLVAIDRKEEILFMIDQHAIAERIKLEKLEKLLLENNGNGYYPANNSPIIYKLECKPPMELNVTFSKLQQIIACEKHLKKWYWEIKNLKTEEAKNENQFSINKTLLVTSTPVLFGRKLGVNELLSYVYQLLDNHALIPRSIKDAIAYKSCRTAIKFGDFLTKDKCQNLINQMKFCKFPFICAHGRPSIVPIFKY